MKPSQIEMRTAFRLAGASGIEVDMIDRRRGGRVSWYDQDLQGVIGGNNTSVIAARTVHLLRRHALVRLQPGWRAWLDGPLRTETLTSREAAIYAAGGLSRYLASLDDITARYRQFDEGIIRRSTP